MERGEVITRICVRCNEEKPLEEGFYKNNTSKSGWRSTCKRCDTVYVSAYQKRNSTRVRERHYARTYDFSLEEYEALLAEQGGLCAICQLPEEGPRYKHLAIDHCHISGQVRGLLCSKCNKALGGFRDSADILRSALAYITCV